MHQMLSNFGYGITPRTVAVFQRVLAEYAATARPDEEPAEGRETDLT